MKILLYTDLKCQAGSLFWHRDLGLLTKAFRSLGHDAWLVVHPALKTPSKIKNPKFPCVSKLTSLRGATWLDGRGQVLGGQSTIAKDPVIWASPSDVRNPSWWQHHQPDLVILGLWTRPKYDPIRRAALGATPRVIERADSDGMRTASCGLRAYARRRYDYFRDRTFRWSAFLSIPASVLYSISSILATPWVEARLARTLKLLPALAVETSHATGLWKRLAKRLSADPNRILCVPHPIQTDIFFYSPCVKKRYRIISVGRWEAYQKNFPLLNQTLLAFLNSHPNWSAEVVGTGLPEKTESRRLHFLGGLSAQKLARRLQAASIFLSSSRYESFGLAATEALACGCRLVAPESLPVLAGTSRTRGNSLLEQLCWEASKPWKRGAKKSIPTPFEPRKVAQRFLKISLNLRVSPPRAL